MNKTKVIIVGHLMFLEESFGHDDTKASNLE